MGFEGREKAAQTPEGLLSMTKEYLILVEQFAHTDKKESVLSELRDVVERLDVLSSAFQSDQEERPAIFAEMFYWSIIAERVVLSAFEFAPEMPDWFVAGVWGCAHVFVQEIARREAAQ